MRGTNWMFVAAVLVNAIILSLGSNECPEITAEDEIILLPHESNCSLFYECAWGQKVVLECPEGLHFNPKSDQCDWPNSKECSDDQRVKREAIQECPLVDLKYDALLPYEEDCRFYYKCVNGEKILHACAANLLFDANLGGCVHFYNAECNKTRFDEDSGEYGRNESLHLNEPICPLEYSGKDVLFPHYNNCSKFLHCDHGKPVEKDCPAGLHFNPLTDRCDWPWNVECVNSPIQTTTEYPNENTTPEAKCSEFEGLLPHETDCTKYYKCNLGRRVLISCPSIWHFNVTEQYCYWPRGSYCYYNRQFGNKPVCSTEHLLDGYFYPHEYDCQRFYVCTDGAPKLFQCPLNLYFNPESNSCEELQEYECESDVIYTR